jgi:hypothetical protein
LDRVHGTMKKPMGAKKPRLSCAAGRLRFGVLSTYGEL